MNEKNDDPDQELRQVIESERRRGRRPVDLAERERQRERRIAMLRAIQEKRWEDVKAALAVLYDTDSAEYKKALEEIRAFDPSARI